MTMLPLVLSLLALISFGPALEKGWCRGVFLLAYLLSIVLGGIAHIMISAVPIAGNTFSIIGLFLTLVISNPKKKIMILRISTSVLNVFLIYTLIAGVLICTL